MTSHTTRLLLKLADFVRQLQDRAFTNHQRTSKILVQELISNHLNFKATLSQQMPSELFTVLKLITNLQSSLSQYRLAFLQGKSLQMLTVVSDKILLVLPYTIRTKMPTRRLRQNSILQRAKQLGRCLSQLTDVKMIFHQETYPAQANTIQKNK
jgi:hypothetical protein